MAAVSVQFRYLTGLKRKIFHNARLLGTWDHAGRLSQSLSEIRMADITCEDGCPAFAVTVRFDQSEIGKIFDWTVRLDTPAAPDVSGVPTEIGDANRTDRVRTFQLQPASSHPQVEDYYLTYARRLGARKVFAHPGSGKPDLRFAVWAPNARQVEVVFGDPAHGYIADDGDGIDPARAPLPMTASAGGIWQTAIVPHFAAHQGLPYMYRITNAQGRTVYRTDIFSRQQVGRGTKNPAGGHWTGSAADLDGTKSCSQVVSVDTVAQTLDSPRANRISRWFRANGSRPACVPEPPHRKTRVAEFNIAPPGFGKANPATWRRDRCSITPEDLASTREAARRCPSSPASLGLRRLANAS
jgi:1,4-alpha-glucan branching enzyme